MRTTIGLDDGLAADLERHATNEGKSVSAVTAEALRAHFCSHETRSGAGPFRLILEKGGGLQPDADVTKLRTIDDVGDLEHCKRRRR